jgi:hypothetical protein
MFTDIDSSPDVMNYGVFRAGTLSTELAFCASWTRIQNPVASDYSIRRGLTFNSLKPIIFARGSRAPRLCCEQG